MNNISPCGYYSVYPSISCSITFWGHSQFHFKELAWASTNHKGKIYYFKVNINSHLAAMAATSKDFHWLPWRCPLTPSRLVCSAISPLLWHWSEPHSCSTSCNSFLRYVIFSSVGSPLLCSVPGKFCIALLVAPFCRMILLPCGI